MTTAAVSPEMQERQRTMFGCLPADLDALVAEHGGPRMIAMSMLSDAQEMIERGDHERARQTINRAKYLIGKHTSDGAR